MRKFPTLGRSQCVLVPGKGVSKPKHPTSTQGKTHLRKCCLRIVTVSCSCPHLQKRAPRSAAWCVPPSSPILPQGVVARVPTRCLVVPPVFSRLFPISPTSHTPQTSLHSIPDFLIHPCVRQAAPKSLGEDDRGSHLSALLRAVLAVQREITDDRQTQQEKGQPNETGPPDASRTWSLENHPPHGALVFKELKTRNSRTEKNP